MGLDIYLYRYDNFEKTRQLEENYNSFSEKLWNDAGEYESLTEEQKDEISNKVQEYALSLGLDKWGSPINGMEQLEESHPDYPDHYFKLGYFRSSYNSGGIERILRNLGLPTMDDIFKHKGEDYHFQPNWEESLVRCEEVIEEFKKGAEIIKLAQIYMQRMDWLLSGDDGEESFLERLKQDKEKL